MFTKQRKTGFVCEHPLMSCLLSVMLSAGLTALLLKKWHSLPMMARKLADTMEGCPCAPAGQENQ